jgi:hypothetical protein
MAQAAANTGMTVPGDKYCIHLTNLSSSVSANQLALMLNISVQDILIDTFHRAAWIKDLDKKERAESLAAQYRNQRLGEELISCQAMREEIHVSELCSFFRVGTCKRENDCNQKHVRCKDPAECINKDCYYGHDRNETLRRNFLRINPNGKSSLRTHTSLRSRR